MDPASELAQLGEASLQLGPGPIQHLGHIRRIVIESGSRQLEGQGEGHESLLSTVVEVALDPPALGVAGSDDPGPRRLDGIELDANLRLEPLVLEGETGRRGDRGHQSWPLAERRIVDERGDGPASPVDTGDRPAVVSLLGVSPVGP